MLQDSARDGCRTRDARWLRLLAVALSLLGLLRISSQTDDYGGDSTREPRTASAVWDSESSDSADASPNLYFGDGVDLDSVEGLESGESEEGDPTDSARWTDMVLHLPTPAVRSTRSSQHGVVAARSRRVASARAPPIDQSA